MPGFTGRKPAPTSPVMRALRLLERKEGKAATKSQVRRVTSQVQPEPAPAKKTKKRKGTKK